MSRWSRLALLLAMLLALSDVARCCTDDEEGEDGGDDGGDDEAADDEGDGGDEEGDGEEEDDGGECTEMKSKGGETPTRRHCVKVDECDDDACATGCEDNNPYCEAEVAESGCSEGSNGYQYCCCVFEGPAGSGGGSDE